MRITIINGPNLNVLGTRELAIYGSKSFELFYKELTARFPQVQLEYIQSNHEGVLIDALQQCSHSADAAIINLAGYTHTSIALADTLKMLTIPVVEVHISNIHARESYRQHSYTGAQVKGVITGLGLEGYALAVQYLSNL